MVDSINPSGQVSGIQPVKNNSPKNQETKENEKSSAPVDEVNISKEALDLAQAEKAAKEVAATLSSDENYSLSNDQERLSTLI